MESENLVEGYIINYCTSFQVTFQEISYGYLSDCKRSIKYKQLQNIYQIFQNLWRKLSIASATLLIHKLKIRNTFDVYWSFIYLSFIHLTYHFVLLPVNLSILTLSWRRPLSYRNQAIDLLRKSMDWFLYDMGLRHERVKHQIW